MVLVAALSLHCRIGYDDVAAAPLRQEAGMHEPDAAVPDAGPIPDAGPPSDASMLDAQMMDAAAPDAKTPDTGAADTGTPDASSDAGVNLPLQASLGRGYTHSCAIADGHLFCWGDNATSKLGLGVGDVAPRNSPQEVGATLVPRPVWGRVCAAIQHTCAITANGSTTGGDLYCWGSNLDGRLGTGGAATNFGLPQPVSGITNLTDIQCQGEFSCALHKSGSVYCWGLNDEGQMGNGVRAGMHATPELVSGLSGVDALSAGEGHVCALKSDKSVWCWGRNMYLEIEASDGSNLAVLRPTQIASSCRAVSAGQNHTCVVTSTGELQCQGHSNSEGEVGLGATGESPTVVQVMGSSALSWLAPYAAMRPHACALTSGHFLYCWGNGEDGQLGTGFDQDNEPSPGPAGDRYVPTAVLEADGGAAAGTWKEVGTGGFHTCALKLDNSLWCWGKNAFGQLGIGADPLVVQRVNVPNRVIWPEPLP